jgi:hypothetical protein
MITVRHQKGVIFITDDYAKVIISNLKEFSDIIQKIKNSNLEETDEIDYKTRIGIIDMLNSVRPEFLRYRELKCLKN